VRARASFGDIVIRRSRPFSAETEGNGREGR
jgi:hypothetical protein